MRCYANETMTCVDRYTGKYLQINGDPFQYAIYRNGTEDRLYLTVHWLQESTETAVRDVLQCRAGGELYDFTDMAGWEDPVCVLPYLTDESDSGAVLYAFVPKGGYGVLYYNFVDYSIFPLYPGNYLTLPKISVSDVVMAGNYTQTVRWSLTPGDDRSGWAVHMELRYREPGEDSWETETLFTDTMENSWRMTTGSTIVGKEAYLLLEYRTYRADWGGYNLEDFVTLNRTVTPWKRVERDAAIPLAPGNIGVSMLLAGGRVTVQWSGVKDPLNAIAAYRLERACAGINETPSRFVQLYNGTSTQFRDTLPGDAGTVIYRICTVNRAGTPSPWTETGIREIAQSNLYVSRGGTWIRAAGVWIGNRRASPMARIR